MPIHKLPNGKWKWGDHGKEYDTRGGAEAQAQAAYANGYKGKSLDKIIKQIQEILEVMKNNK